MSVHEHGPLTHYMINFPNQSFQPLQFMNYEMSFGILSTIIPEKTNWLAQCSIIYHDSNFFFMLSD